MAAHTKKVTIAREQLEDAIELFLDKRYISALTLLGAVDIIFNEEIKRKKGIDIDEQLWERNNRIRSKFGVQHMSKSKYISGHRKAYNSVKHYDHKDKSDRQYIEPFAEAFMLIQPAIAKADFLELKYKNRSKYMDWYKKHWE
ncbi:hypothetical protein [Spongorhabdus nitratireducens]